MSALKETPSTTEAPAKIDHYSEMFANLPWQAQRVEPIAEASPPFTPPILVGGGG